MRFLSLGVAALAFLLLFSTGHFNGRTAAAADGSTLNRPEDPVVLTGADVPSLTGSSPHDLVAFPVEWRLDPGPAAGR